MDEVSALEARRIALAAQGFARPRPARATLRHVRATIERLGVLQIDSVNVLVRAHYLPLFSRLGPYPRAALDELAYRRRELFEYWGHQASLLPIELYPAFRWRMELVHGSSLWPGFSRWAQTNTTVVEAVAAEVAARGPVGVSDLAEPGKRSGPWWGWSDGKTSLEWLYTIGRVTVAARRNFERIYDLTERVLPEHVVNGAALSPNDAIRVLVRRAARALGIGTAKDIADYYGLKVSTATPALEALVADGELVRARVEGWRQGAFRDPAVNGSGSIEACALVSPFDSLMFNRARVERLFGFTYTIEIYVPKPKRVYGYYVLPFLLGEHLVARVDLKADRKASALLVQGAFAEPGVDRGTVARALSGELTAMARWLDLSDVVVTRRGDLAAPLKRASA